MSQMNITRGYTAIAAAVCALVWGAAAQGQAVPLSTVQDLYAACSGPTIPQQLACLVSVRGIADSTSACTARAATYAAIKSAFLSWAAAHRERWQDPASTGLRQSFQEGHPCSDK